MLTDGTLPQTDLSGEDAARRAAEMDEISAFLFELAIDRPEHSEMLFRLADIAKRQADKLRAQCLSQFDGPLAATPYTL